MDRALYRTRQFAKAVGGRVDPTLEAAALGWLGSLAPIFSGMPRSARRHHLDVFAALRRQGETNADLLAAALLHDSGKGFIHPLARVAFVLLSAIHPSLPARLAWRGGWLERLVNHPILGARQVAVAGGSERLVWLIEHHQDTVDDADLRRLQQADNGN